MAERRGLFVIQSIANAVAQRVCHHVLIQREEISAIQIVAPVDAQHSSPPALEPFTALWHRALVIIFLSTIHKYITFYTKELWNALGIIET